MTIPLRFCAASAIFLAMLSSTAGASELIDATKPEEIVNIARGFGAANLETDADGDPQITGRIDGNAYVIFFYGCVEARDCTTLQFSAGWISDDIDLEAINGWNRDHRFGRAYLDGENDPIVELDVNMEFGITRRNFDDTFRVWAAILAGFAEFVER